jgi:predicted Zn-dependent protease
MACRYRPAASAEAAHVIRRKDLLRALGDTGLADWVLVEYEQDSAIADAQLRRTERWLKWRLTVHHDAPTGRGSAHVLIDAAEGNAEEVVQQAVALARASVGTAWATRPPAAPARVQVADRALSEGDLLPAATQLATGLKRPATVTVDARAHVMRERVTLVTRQGLKTEWLATRVRLDATVASSDHALVVSREARRREDLGFDPAIQSAAEDLGLLATAKAIQPGPCTLVLKSEALLHGGLGLWHAFASQADALLERQGLTRYRERHPVAPGADAGSERLTITSDGALDFGIASAPVGDEGEAVRRFTIVERGVAAGLGLSPREGARRGRDPNGGVRNLVVDAGSWNGAIDGTATRVLEIRRLRSLSIDPHTGDASLEILLGVEHAKGARTPFAAGSLRVDAIAALATARRSRDVIRRGAYVGPDSVMIVGAELFA